MPRSLESYEENYDSLEKARRYAHKYERQPAKRLTMAMERRILRHWLRPFAGGTILDVPCGAGRLSDVLLEAGLRVTEADVSAAMVRACAERHGPRCRYAVASAAALPFPD
ncbi:MAG: methyltransferase domain-containing protein, partial [Planctomycetes bacterium]|nr:methyltransferase domain-containing protein [Planctomycetota bacterium]